MVDYQNIEDILDNSEYMFSKLFKFYSNESDQMKGKNEKLRFCINELNSYYDSKKELITREQDIFLCKLILSFFDSFENRNELNNEEKFKEILYEEHLRDILKENQYNELIKINKSENVKLTIENIIFFLIKLLLKYSVNYKENAEQNKLTPEEKWNQIGLHLEFFEINEIIRKELEVFLKEENNVNVRNYFKEIDLITNIKDPKNNSKILSDIYEYLQFKSIKKMKKLRLKSGGDLERENDDYARNLLIKETDDNSEYIPVFNKDEFANIKRILKRLDIKINLDTILNQNETKYYIYDGNTQITLTRLIETGFGNYNERNEIKIYKKYLEFIKEIRNYIKRFESLIIYKTEIYLTLQPVQPKQRDEVLHDEFDRKDQIKDIPEVKCLSYFYPPLPTLSHPADDEKENDDKKRIYFKDENVLIYGIYNKLQGFIYMINELCNKDYENIEKESTTQNISKEN